MMDKEAEQRIEDLERRLGVLEEVVGFTDMKQGAVARFLEQRSNRREQWRRRSAAGNEQ